MIDVSDGLVADVGHLAEGSGVAIDIDPTAFPLDEPLQAVGAALGVDPMQFVLGGGEDHPLVATFPPDVPLPDGFREIGRVSARGDADSPAVTVAGTAYEGVPGHTHF
jgi:thiamine-monophosphate kinase